MLIVWCKEDIVEVFMSVDIMSRVECGMDVPSSGWIVDVEY